MTQHTHVSNQSPRGRNLLVGLGLFFVVLAAGGVVWSLPAERRVPAVVFNTIGGEQLTSEVLRGKVTLVSFWSTTCSVCMKEMPALIQTYQEFHARGFDVVAVAMPYDRPDWVLEYSQRKALPFKVAIDYDAKVNQAFGGIAFTPTSFLIDQRGRIVSRIVGAPDFGKLRGEIERELGRRRET